MIKVLKIFKNLSDVAICEKDMPDGTKCVKVYAYEDTPCADADEEKTIREKLEVAFKVKLD